MTSKEFSAIGEKVSHLMPSYVVKGSLLFKVTPDALLLGVIFDGSSRDRKLFRVHAFFLPLFVPTDTIRLNYSRRISLGSGQWDADDPNLIDSLTRAIRMDAIPFLNAMSTLREVADFIRPMVIPDVDGYVSPYYQEALAYVLVKLNDFRGALAMLHQLQSNLYKPTAEWEFAMLSRARVVERNLTKNVCEVLKQFEVWESETLKNLKIKSVRK